jgi:hypothetical protein
MTERPSREEVERLKQSWKSDPHWDLEETAGYEYYRDELAAYRKQVRESAELRRLIALRDKAETLGCPGNLKLAEYVEGLERRVDELRALIGDTYKPLSDRLRDVESRYWP